MTQILLVKSALQVNQAGGLTLWVGAILGMLVVVFGFAFMIVSRRKVIQEHQEQTMISDEPASLLPPLPDTKVKCEYCGTEQSRNETCVRCGRPLPMRRVSIEGPRERPAVTVRYQPARWASSVLVKNSVQNMSAADLRNYSRRHWKMALPVALLLYVVSIPLVSYGASDQSLFMLLIFGAVGVFFAGPIALAYGVGWFFQARSDTPVFSKVMSTAAIVFVIASAIVFYAISYSTINCANPSAYWWDWRDFYGKCGFYPPTH